MLKIKGNQYQSSFIILIFITILLFAILIFIYTLYISKSITKPILKIHHDTQIIGEGNLDHIINIQTRDELSELADAINLMTRNLDQTTVSRKKLQKEVEERKEVELALKKSLQEKEVLIREIHHRVKNNMQLIISMFNLQNGDLNKKESQTLTDISNRIRMFGNIYRKLYQQEDFSQIDFGKQLKEILQELIKAYNIVHQEILLDLQINRPDFTLDQAIPLGILLNELISNSLKHAFSDVAMGKIHIIIDQNSQHEIVEIIYYDNGKINPEVKKNKPGFGTQVIKALSKQLQLSMEISLENNIRYQFTIDHQENEKTEETGSILYVEDEVLIALERIHYLKEKGLDINNTIFATGEKAIKYVKETTHKPKLILIDIGLKGPLNGLETALEIRKDYPHIPFIFLSGYDDQDTVNQINQISNAGFLTKTSTNEQIIKKINQFIQP